VLSDACPERVANGGCQVRLPMPKLVRTSRRRSGRRARGSGSPEVMSIASLVILVGPVEKPKLGGRGRFIGRGARSKSLGRAVLNELRAECSKKRFA
jgi:hypothetical protein